MVTKEWAVNQSILGFGPSSQEAVRICFGLAYRITRTEILVNYVIVTVGHLVMSPGSRK